MNIRLQCHIADSLTDVLQIEGTKHESRMSAAHILPIKQLTVNEPVFTLCNLQVCLFNPANGQQTTFSPPVTVTCSAFNI